ncbi:MAG TPA: pyridoxal 5'-phosphate synthase glutaminase subunit PdxT [Firmicutes bacterium]|nr:pyridoxal 5'-phosphate synthase glutaminase subunit PdxT [Bacillota bacterium]
MKIGVLALQGAVREHVWALQACGAETVTVKGREDLAGLDGLVIPGGESTTVGKLLKRFQLWDAVRERAQAGMGIFGTCTGMILLAKGRAGDNEPRLGLIECEVVRNAFGRQVDSFETELAVPVLGEQPFPAVFIRAPYLINPGRQVEVLATLDGKIVLARQGKILAGAFHPELTGDLRLHRYFLDLLRCGED